MLTIRASVFGHLMNTEINLTVEPVCAISERIHTHTELWAREPSFHGTERWLFEI